MAIRLSIVVPFYNVEPYISQCLDSIYTQDIPEDEYEVICVNDASLDHSRDIVVNYQREHKNLILVEHDMNRKLGAARNTGRTFARGKYLWNVDSDDMITPNCLSEVLMFCEDNDLDVFFFSFDILENGTRRSRKRIWQESTKAIPGLQFWKQQVISHQSVVSQVWTQVYRRDFLDRKCIFSPEINMGEDISYTYKGFLLADRVWVSNTPYYIWRRNPLSLMGAIVRTPKPSALYESSYVSGRILHGVLSSIPPIEKEIRLSVINTIRYLIIKAWKVFPKLDSDSQVAFLKLCRKGVFKNLFVFRDFNKKQLSFYISFLIKGRSFKLN